MNVIEDKMTWEDLREVVERHPGLLRAPSDLRKIVHEGGGFTLVQLLEWQAATRPTRIGPLPVSEHGIDMLDKALQDARTVIATLSRRLDERGAEITELREREAAYKAVANLDWEQMRRFAEALGDAVEAFER